MVNVKEGIEVYKLVKSWVHDYKSWCRERGVKGNFDELVEYINKGNMSVCQIDDVEDNGDTLDIDIGSISVCVNEKFVIDDVIEMLNVPCGKDIDIGGWVEYNVKTGVMNFPFVGG